MKSDRELRAVYLGQYITEYNATVRQAAKHFGFSKSIVHQDVTVKLKNISLSLYEQVAVILASNKADRHYRGGAATKEKWGKIKNNP